jgi:hypothetical protein
LGCRSSSRTWTSRSWPETSSIIWRSSDRVCSGSRRSVRRAGDLGAIGAVLAGQGGGAALQGQDPGLGREALGGQLLHALQFLLDQLLLLAVGVQLALGAAGLLAQLQDPLVEHPALGLQRAATRLELLALQPQGVVGQGLVLGRQVGELRRRGDGRQAIALGDQAGALGQQGQDLAGHAALAGPQLRGRQLDQDLALDHALALDHPDGGDHPALAALHGLAVARHGDHAVSVGAGVQRRQGRPAQEADEEQARHPRADADDADRIVRQAGRDLRGGLAGDSGGGTFSKVVSVMAWRPAAE